MLNYSDYRFKLGPKEVYISEIYSFEIFQRLQFKFSQIHNNELLVLLRELTRYLYLSAHAPNEIFFPGTQTMDDIWHALITETAEYRDICSRIRAGTFIDHSGMKYEKYISLKGNEEAHAAHSSWLCSYVHNFGPLESESYPHLVLAQALAQEMQFDLDLLNEYASTLLQLSQQNSDAKATFHQFLKSVATLSPQLDSDRILVGKFLRNALEFSDAAANEPKIIPPTYLEDLYGYSIALAFTLSQHLAAVERLMSLNAWQSKNFELWEQISTGAILCGLATTHLARKDQSLLKCEVANNTFILNGTVPWVCGYEIFDKLIVGFETENKLFFALIDFPHQSTDRLSFSVLEMIGLNGMGTINIEFNNFIITEGSIISSRTTSEVPPAIRPSRYCIPDLGFGKKIYSDILSILDTSLGFKETMSKKYIGNLTVRLKEIEDLRHENPLDTQLVFLKDNFNHDALELLSILTGPKALYQPSYIKKLQSELLFLKYPVKSQENIERQVKQICAPKY